jgi:low affinity Fe/Cu permease
VFLDVSQSLGLVPVTKAFIGYLTCRYMPNPDRGPNVFAIRANFTDGSETIVEHKDVMTTTNSWFAKMAQKAAKATGSSPAFLTVCVLTLVWLVSGPFFHWSDTWQLIINTVSNIVAMLMLFLIQNTQNRESAALQLKADELLRAVRGAQNAFINLEELSEEDLIIIKERYARMAELARAKAGINTLSGPAQGDLPD